MIDTHAHIYLPQYQEDQAQVIQRAKQAGIKHIILPNIDTTTLQAMHQLEATDPKYLHATIGLHPTSVKQNYQEQLHTLHQQLQQRTYCAIGEIGIDLYWDKTHLHQQIHALEQQLQWAIDLQIPVILHVRDAFQQTINTLSHFANTPLKAIFHSFGGTPQQADIILQNPNFFIGINGIITFKNTDLKHTITHIPLTRILLETDAPYLTPAPYRGKRNEPAHIQYTAQAIAQAHHTTQQAVQHTTTTTAHHLFKL